MVYTCIFLFHAYQDVEKEQELEEREQVEGKDDYPKVHVHAFWNACCYFEVLLLKK